MQNFDWNMIQPFIYPIIIIIGSMFIGFILEKVLFAIIKKKTKVQPKGKVDFATRTLKLFMILLFFILGVYASIDILPMKPSLILTLKQISEVIIIFAVTYVIANITVGLINMKTRKGGEVQPSTSIINNLLRTIIYIIGFTIILQTAGISITPIITALGISGLAVALALQDTLSNFFAGLHIIASGQVKVGDYIRLDNGQEGYVTDIKWRDTTIRALASNMIIVPNTKLSSNIIVNYYQPAKELGVSLDMVVALNSDLTKVEKICTEVATDVMKNIQGGIPNSEPSVRFSAFLDNGIRFSVNMRIEEYINQYLVKHEFIKKIVPRFENEGIKFPIPLREVIMKNKE